MSYVFSIKKNSTKKDSIEDYMCWLGVARCAQPRLDPQVFSCKFCEISKNTFFKEHRRATASMFLEDFQPSYS